MSKDGDLENRSHKVLICWAQELWRTGCEPVRERAGRFRLQKQRALPINYETRPERDST